MRFLILMFYIVAADQCFAADDSLPISQSPTGDFIIKSITDKTSNQNGLWIVSSADSNLKELLYEYPRTCTALVAPNGKMIAVNTHYSSDESAVILFELSRGLKFSLVQKLDISGLSKKFYLKEVPGSFIYDHWYVDCIGWSSNSENMLLKLYGHEDNERLYGWFCIFNWKDQRCSLELKRMNK